MAENPSWPVQSMLVPHTFHSRTQSICIFCMQWSMHRWGTPTLSLHMGDLIWRHSLEPNSHSNYRGVLQGKTPASHVPSTEEALKQLSLHHSRFTFSFFLNQSFHLNKFFMLVSGCHLFYLFLAFRHPELRQDYSSSSTAVLNKWT